MSFYVKFDGFEYEEIKKIFEKINCKETKILYKENLLQEYIDYLIDRQIKQIKEYNKEYNTNYEECEKLLQKLLSDSKITDNSILLRCNLLLIEIYLSLYCMKGETKEVFINIFIL